MPYTNCIICGKPLSDPISVATGMGEVCRVAHKQSLIRERSGNLFSSRAEYKYGFDNHSIWIEDLLGLKSVTNDIENILKDIDEENGVGFCKKKKVMYKDSQGIWDGIRVNDNYTVEFYSIHETSLSAAKNKLLEIR